MKKCCKCKIEKDLVNFGISRKEKDGLNLTCFQCRKEWRDLNKDRIKKQRVNYFSSESYRKHKAKYDLSYRKNNQIKIKNYKDNWTKRRKHEPIFKIKRNLRRRLHHVIKDGYKSDSTMNLLGCSFPEFKSYLEQKFQSGMTWENYGMGEGKWHIDHIRPCCDFDLTKPEEQQKCFHYSNMQPLWEKENLKKSYIYEGKNCRTNSRQ